MNLLKRMCKRGHHKWRLMQRNVDSMLGDVYQCERGCGNYMGIVHPDNRAMLRELKGE